MIDARTTSPSTTVRSPILQRSGRGRVAIAILLPGCGLAPSVNVLGSFFPAWLICIVIGLVLTVLTWQGFVAMKIASHLGPASLVYPCLAALWIFAAWLLLFGS